MGAVAVSAADEIMLITDSGTLVRTPVKDVSQMGRNTQGVRLLRLDDGSKISSVTKVIKDEDSDSPPVETEATENPED